MVADSLVFERYSTRAGFTHDLTRWSAIPVLGKLLPYLVFAWALRRYQRFHFFYNRAFLAQIEPGRFNTDELELVLSTGAEVFFWAYGADVRHRERTLQIGSPNACAVCPAVGRLCVCDDPTAIANYRFVRAHATGCATMGDMRAYTPGADDTVFYWPVDLDEDDGRTFRPGPTHERRSVVVAHAPNNRELKGTAHLERAVATLRNEGLPIELDLIEGVTNDEVLDRFRRADIVVDQCIIGFHGYTALEAMAIARPVLCFLREPERDLVDPATCPIVNASPAELTDELRRLVTDRGLRKRLGDAGRDYVAEHHSIRAVGLRIQRFTEEARSRA